MQEFARLFGSRVLLLHPAEPGIDEENRKSRLGEIRLLSESLSRAGIRTEVCQRQGDPAQEILDCSQAEGAALIAMTTHGPSGPSRWSLGSVTE